MRKAPRSIQSQPGSWAMADNIKAQIASSEALLFPEWTIRCDLYRAWMEILVRYISPYVLKPFVEQITRSSGSFPSRSHDPDTVPSPG